MKETILSLYLICLIFQCNGVSLRRQLEHIAKTRLEGQGLLDDMPSRRYRFDPRELTGILGAPNRPSHLPEAEVILPGHTLNRPALGMLKSSIKFPHKELEDGAGVYGNIDKLGIKYDSRNERLLYTGFRRSPSDYIMVIPSNSDENLKPRFRLESTVLDMDERDTVKNQLLNIIKRLDNTKSKGKVRVYFGDLNNNYLNNLRTSEEVDTPLNWNEYLNDKNLYVRKSVLPNAYETGYQQRWNIPPLDKDTVEVSDTDHDAKSKKIQWLYSSKDKYNHIKINQDAPELNELVPPIKNDDIRQWWFYSADDFKQFS